MFCRHCGVETGDNDSFCVKCGKEQNAPQEQNQSMTNFEKAHTASAERPLGVMDKCPKCSSTNIIEFVSEEKAGCISILLYLILLGLPVIGWAVLIWLIIGRKGRVIFNYTCRDCKKNWKIKQKNLGDKIAPFILVIFLIVLVIFALNFERILMYF